MIRPIAAGASPASAHACATLFEMHATALRRYAQRIVRSREAAEDVVQEVFLRLWLVWPTIEVGAGTRSYLYMSTRDRALNHVRLDRRREAREWIDRARAIGRDDASMTPTAGEADTDDEVSRAIARVIAMMPARQGLVASLRVREQLTTAEIATRLDISPRTVEVHVARATQAFRLHLPAMLSDRGARRLSVSCHSRVIANSAASAPHDHTHFTEGEVRCST